MYSIVKTIFAVTCILIFSVSFCNAATKDLVLKNGHVADILLLTLKEAGKPYQKAYFEDIGPSGRKLGYAPNTFFYITRKPISGMYFPKVLAVGSWPGDWQQRQKLFDELLVLAPEIRSRRLDIWSTFNMINFEVKKDINVSFDPEQIYVFGAYWTGAIDFDVTLSDAIKKAGGTIEYSANSVGSMFGYQRAPDMSLISRWPNQQAFDTFYQKYSNGIAKDVEHSSEFYLDIQ